MKEQSGYSKRIDLWVEVTGDTIWQVNFEADAIEDNV